MAKDSRLVYSTDQGRIKTTEELVEKPKTDGVIRIQRETKGRKGAGVMIITGFDLNDKELKLIAKKLKQVCSSGGTCKAGTIEIQGDHRLAVKEYLEKQGHKVKLVGG